MTDGRDFDLAGLLAELRRRAWLIALCTLAAAGIAFGISQVLDKRYEATADLLFAEENPNAPERTAATNLALASLDSVMFRVKRRLGSDEPIDELRKQFELEPRGQSDIVRVVAKGPTPERAASLANVFAEEVVGLRREREQQALQRQVVALDGQIEQGGGGDALTEDLEQRRQALLVEKALATGDVEVADPAVPPREAAAPRPLRYTAVAALLGLVLSIGLVLALRTVQRRVDEKEVSRIFGAPILARVPTRRRRAWREQLYLEAFQFLRANVATRLAKRGEAGGRREGRLIAITSPLPGNGKSTVVAALADALALNGSEVLAVDCDLRKPALAQEFGLPDGGSGLAEALLNHQAPESYLVETPVPGVTLLPGGLLGSDFAVAHATARRLPEVLSALRGEADVVLVDTAPVALAAETSIVTSVADDVIVVVDARDLRRDALEDTRDQLDRAGAKVLGIVLNRTEVPEDRTLKSAYGRPYRTARASRADEGEALPAEALEPELHASSAPPPRSTARR